MPSNNDKCIVDAIDNTVTPEDVATVVRRFTGDPLVQVLKYDLKAFSSEKLGFLGSHRKLTIEFKKQNENNTKTINFFVKSMPYDFPKQCSFLLDTCLFDEEYNFFDKIVPHLLENYEGDKYAPTCYLAKSDSLIMEDLRDQNYAMRACFLNSYAELKSALSALARFHASSVLAEAKLARQYKEPRTLAEHYPNSFAEKFFQKRFQTYKWLVAGTNINGKIGEKYGYDPNKLRKGIQELEKLVKTSKVHRNVITHNDLWSNNLMFDDSQPLAKCVLVDFQIVRYAPQALDILKILYFHASRDFREVHETKLVKDYYSVFEETINKSHLVSDAKVPSLSELFAAVDDLRLYGPGMASLYFPVVLLDPEIIKEKTKTPEGYDEFLFGDRIDVTFDNLENKEVYRNRIKENIAELAKLCDKL